MMERWCIYHINALGIALFLAFTLVNASTNSSLTTSEHVLNVGADGGFVKADCFGEDRSVQCSS
jgi:hypothetical protein